MITLALRSDKPEAEIYVYRENLMLGSDKWPAHKQLSDTMLEKISLLLQKHDISLNQIERMVVFAGPGSFTGLRIGHSVANALAYGLGISVVSKGGEDWLREGLADHTGQFVPVSPFYGSEAHITRQKK